MNGDEDRLVADQRERDAAVALHGDNARSKMPPNQRRAAHRAQMREEDWTHPRDPREDGDTTERLACEDPYCRFCKDQDGEVRDGFNL